MLTEHETEQLAALVDAYGLKGVVDALATEAQKRGTGGAVSGSLHPAIWSHDATVLTRTLRNLWPKGRW